MKVCLAWNFEGVALTGC